VRAGGGLVAAELLPHRQPEHLAVDHQHLDDDHHFLLVALLQNSQRRSEPAVQTKLDALVDGLADLVSTIGGSGDRGDAFDSDIKELRAAVGAEQSSD
jgi:hypothetical protein